MTISPKDIVPLSRARATLTELCDRLEREHIHLILLREVMQGLGDLKAGKTLTLAQLKSRHGR